MAIDVAVLLTKTTAELEELRASYRASKRVINKMHSTRSVTYPTDIRRCDDAVRMINQIIRERTRPRKALRGFSSA